MGRGTGEEEIQSNVLLGVLVLPFKRGIIFAVSVLGQAKGDTILNGTL